MKVITFNLPKAQKEQLDEMHGEDKDYSSRSDVIRIAVKEWIKKQIPFIKMKLKNKPETPEPEETEAGMKLVGENQIKIGNHIHNLKSLI
jgi:Arc/MetJ-type ribon-helix-helix transcriptional regulator